MANKALPLTTAPLHDVSSRRNVKNTHSRILNEILPQLRQQVDKWSSENQAEFRKIIMEVWNLQLYETYECMETSGL